MAMNAISKYHSGIIATDKCTIENFNGTEWYSVVINSISKFHSGIIVYETGKLMTSVILTGIQ